MAARLCAKCLFTTACDGRLPDADRPSALDRMAVARPRGSNVQRCRFCLWTVKDRHLLGGRGRIANQQSNHFDPGENNASYPIKASSAGYALLLPPPPPPPPPPESATLQCMWAKQTAEGPSPQTLNHPRCFACRESPRGGGDFLAAPQNAISETTVRIWRLEIWGAARKIPPLLWRLVTVKVPGS